MQMQFDVIVVGGGGSGLAAAASAAENGASVLLLEKQADDLHNERSWRVETGRAAQHLRQLQRAIDPLPEPAARTYIRSNWHVTGPAW